MGKIGKRIEEINRLCKIRLWRKGFEELCG
jgi:hypothetical protein